LRFGEFASTKILYRLIIKHHNHHRSVAAIFHPEGSMKNWRFSKILAGLITSLILLVMVGTSAIAAMDDTTRVSVASDSPQGTLYSTDGYKRSREMLHAVR
jgi:hypothetical protein